MLLNLLAFYEKTCRFLKPYFQDAQQYARDWLGPSPQNILLLEDGQVLPSTTNLPDIVRNSAHLFDPLTNQMTLLNNPSPEGRFRRLHYLSAELQHELVGSLDISDWIGEIRANPVPHTMSLKQLFQLYGQVHSTYIPLSDGVTITGTTSDGETVTINL